MEIRLATPADYKSYCLLASEIDALHAKEAPRYYRSVGDPPRTKEYFDAMIKDPSKAVFVAEVDGTIAGYLHLESRKQPDNPILIPMDWTNISDIVVGKGFQRRGVGKALLGKAKSWARDHGAKEIRLSVAKFNDIAKALYQLEGFHELHQVLAFPLK